MLDKIREDLHKALNLATGVTQGMIQPKIDKVIADLLEHDWPLWQNLPKKPWDTIDVEYREKTAQTGGTGGGWVADTAEPTGDAGMTRSTASVRHRTVLERGGVTTAMQKGGANYKDLLAQEIDDIMVLVRDTIEDAIINGDQSVTAAQPSGVRKLTPAGQIVTAATNGAPITLDMLDETIDKLLGNAKMILSSRRTRRQINALLKANQMVADTKEVKGAFKLPAYSDIPIFTSSRISDAQTQGSASNASDLFVIDTQFVWVSILEAIHMVPLAKTSSQLDKFDIRAMLCLIVKNTTHGVARLQGIVPEA